MAILQSLAGKAGKAIDVVGGFAGNRLPELNISESLQSYGGAPQGQPFAYVPPQPQAVSSPSFSGGGSNQPGSFTQSTPGQVLSAQNVGATGQITTGDPGQTPGPNPNPNPGPQGPSEMDLINQEFNNFQQMLNEAEATSQQEFADTEASIGREKELGLSEVASERASRQKGLENKAAEGKANERLNLQRVRQLLQDLEQRNAARLSVTGGGSLSDALADRFGRTAQQSVGGVLQEGQRFQNDISVEMERAQDFYDRKKMQIQNSAEDAIAQARQRLNQTIDAIRTERRGSAMDKNRATVQAWRDYYNNVNQAKLAAANFSVQYDMWKRQLDAQMAAAQGYQVSDIAGQDFNPAMAYAQQGLNIGNQPSGFGALSNPNTYIDMRNPNGEEEDLNQING